MAWIEKGLDAVGFNPTGGIGPCDFEPSRMGRLFRVMRRARVRVVVGGALDWVEVGDVAAGMIAAAARGRTAASYLVAGHQLSMRELAELVARVTGFVPPGCWSRWPLPGSRPGRSREDPALRPSPAAESLRGLQPERR